MRLRLGAAAPRGAELWCSGQWLLCGSSSWKTVLCVIHQRGRGQAGSLPWWPRGRAEQVVVQAAWVAQSCPDLWLLSSSSGNAEQLRTLMPVRFSLWLFLHGAIPASILTSLTASVVWSRGCVTITACSPLLSGPSLE